MDRFEFFFTFYSLLLGLGAVELLGGFAGFVRAKALRQMEPQTALLAVFTFVAICATWIDAWNVLQGVTIDFAGLTVPILIATCYYLAATVVFPSDPEQFARLDLYYAERKRFVVGMLLVAEVLVTFTFIDMFATVERDRPAVFWLWLVPYNISVKLGLIILWWIKGRTANLIALGAIILLFMIPYWSNRAITNAISQAYGYVLPT